MKRHLSTYLLLILLFQFSSGFGQGRYIQLADSIYIHSLDSIKEWSFERNDTRSVLDYYLENRDTNSARNLYQNEMAWGKEKCAIDSSKYAYSNIHGTYYEILSLKDLQALNHIDSTVPHLRNKSAALPAMLMAKYLELDMLDSALSVVIQEPNRGSCQWCDKMELTLTYIAGLRSYVSQLSKDEQLDFFNRKLKEVPNPNCESYYYGIPDHSFYDPDLEKLKTALELGFFNKLSAYPKYAYVGKAHFDTLFRRAAYDQYFENLNLIPERKYRVESLSDNLYYGKPSIAMTHQLLDSILGFYKTVKLNPDIDIYHLGAINHLLSLDRPDDIEIIREAINKAGAPFFHLKYYRSMSEEIDLRLANYYLSKGQTNRASSFALKIKKLKNLEIDQLGRYGQLCYSIGLKRQLNKAHAILSKIKPQESKKKYWKEQKKHDVALALANTGFYDEAWAKAKELYNDGPCSQRSTTICSIYSFALNIGDPVKGNEILEWTIQDLSQVEHPNQRHWYIREAAVQYAKLGNLKKALEVTAMMNDNTYNKFGSTFHRIQTALRKAGTDTITFEHFDEFLDIAYRCESDDREEIAYDLLDIFYDMTPDHNLNFFEDKLASLACSKGMLNIEKFKFLADLYLATRESQDVVKIYDEMISSALQLNKAKDRVEALVYLQENYDELND